MVARLSKIDWLEHGLKTLAAVGAGGLKAEAMAKTLRVSRGSFYWHFKDIGEFRAALLDLWQERATRRVIEDIDRIADRSGQLLELLNRAFYTSTKLESAVRAWATQDEDVAEKVASVDRIRVEFLVNMLAREGVSAASARPRSVFLYLAYLGTISLGNETDLTLSPAELEAMAALVLN